MTDSVRHEPRLHAVSSKKNGIAIDELSGDCWLRDIPEDCFVSDAWLGIQGNAFGNPDLRRGRPPQETSKQAAARTEIASLRAHDPRIVCWFYALIVDHDDMTDAKACEVLVDQRAGTASPDDPDLLVGKDGLPSVAEQTNLSVILRPSATWSSRGWSQDI